MQDVNVHVYYGDITLKRYMRVAVQDDSNDTQC